MLKSKIEWTHYTFNPWIGCTKVSDGCKFCYAEAVATRFGRIEWGPNGNRGITSYHYWRQPLKWNQIASKNGVRYRVFCAPMADVFEDDSTIPKNYRHWISSERTELFKLIDATPHLDWLVLTKRPQNILSMWPGGYRDNVWLGTSVEDIRYVSRLDELRQANHLAKFLFICVEPLIGQLSLNLHQMDWVVVGGESGPNARPMNPSWALNILDQCRAAGVKFYMKQLSRCDGIGYKNFRKFPQALRVRSFP